ncbi:MAG TPA: ABA4-like family protein [Polyangiaceae bacterium]|nr:ABA4-like family protein [Polyangiaceae bacterium]
MAVLFFAGNACVLPFWGAMLVAPGSSVTERWLRSPWICAPFAAVYVLVFGASLGDLAKVARAPSFAAIAAMIGTPLGTNLAWLHYLTGDLFVGRWIYWDSRPRAIGRGWLALVFLLGLTFCPIALLSYLVLRARHPLPGDAPAANDPGGTP